MLCFLLKGHLVFFQFQTYKTIVEGKTFAERFARRTKNYRYQCGNVLNL